MKKLVIAGGTGFLGQALAQRFIRLGWDVVILTRAKDAGDAYGRAVHWDGRTLGPWVAELEGAYALANLCGKSVNCRYTPRNRELILRSRIDPTNVLAKALQAAKKTPSVWLNASSATLYRESFDQPMDDESETYGQGFSEDVCLAWEKAFFAPELPDTRRVALRTSMVLGNGKNSVLPTLARLARFGLGGRMSGGQQMVSWIHEVDFVRAVAFAIEEEDLEGPLNISAPAPATNAVFMRTLRSILGVPLGLPHVKPLLELGAMLLRTETELVLKSRFVTPTRLLKHRFLFRYPFLDEAMANLLSSSSSSSAAASTSSSSSPSPNPALPLNPNLNQFMRRRIR